MKTIVCKLCKAKIVVTPGLDEIEEHWADWHPVELDKLRAKSAPIEEEDGKIR